jgi:hypothetical protein
MPCFLLDCSARNILMQLQRKLHKDISTRLQRKFQQHFRSNHHVSSSKTRTGWSNGLIDTLQNYNAEVAGSGVLRVEWTCRVQMPFGPRKSGMPHEVEMPAPVNTTKCWLCTQVHTHIYSSFLISGKKGSLIADLKSTEYKYHRAIASYLTSLMSCESASTCTSKSPMYRNLCWLNI